MGDALTLFTTRFFLCVDDWEEAYETLRQVVKEYLLLEDQEEGDNNHRGSPDNAFTGICMCLLVQIIISRLKASGR